MMPASSIHGAAAEKPPVGSVTSYGGWAHDHGPMDRVDHAVLQVSLDDPKSPRTWVQPGAWGRQAHSLGAPATLATFLPSCLAV
jgi:hypothetical protein